jgi:hypothetical protein
MCFWQLQYSIKTHKQDAHAHTPAHTHTQTDTHKQTYKQMHTNSHTHRHVHTHMHTDIHDRESAHTQKHPTPHPLTPPHTHIQNTFMPAHPVRGSERQEWRGKGEGEWINDGKKILVYKFAIFLSLSHLSLCHTLTHTHTHTHTHAHTHNCVYKSPLGQVWTQYIEITKLCICLFCKKKYAAHTYFLYIVLRESQIWSR